MRHGASFALTPGWHMEGTVRYLLQQREGILYGAVPKDRFEQDYAIVRDLHCWTARVTYRRRPGFYEAFVRLELKSKAADRRALQSPDEKQYYPGRYMGD
jgi:hypothetical protein